MSVLSVAFIALLLVAGPQSPAAADNEKITQDELVHRSQELVDAVAVGNREPWKQYFAEARRAPAGAARARNLQSLSPPRGRRPAAVSTQ